MVDTMDAVDIEGGVSHTSAFPPMRRINSIQSDGENSDESYRSRWSNEMTGDEESDPPPRRPTYRTVLGAPTYTFPSSSGSSYTTKGNPWNCASCSYQNTDYHNTTCALCGSQLTKPASIDDRSMSPSPTADRSVISLASNISRVNPLSDQIIKSPFVESTTAVGVSSPQSYSSKRSIISLESLNTFLSRKMSQKSRRTPSSSVGSQGSVSTVKMSNTVQDHFWRTRSQAEIIIGGAKGTYNKKGSTRNVRTSAPNSNTPHDIGGSLNSRGLRSPRAATGKPVHDSNEVFKLEVSPTLLIPASLRSSLSSPAPMRSPYAPPYTPSQDACIECSFRSDVQKQESNFEAQKIDVSLLASPSASYDDPSSAFDQKAPSHSTDQSRTLTLDDQCASATYRETLPAQMITQDKATTSSGASVFVTDPALPRERARALKPRTRSRLTLAAVLCLLLVAIVMSVTVLVLATKKDDANSSFTISNRDPTDDAQTVVPEENLPTSFPIETNQPTPAPAAMMPITMSPTTEKSSEGSISVTPSATEQGFPLEEFVQSGQSILGGVADDQAGTFVELANSGSVLVESRRSGVVRVHALAEEGPWLQLGQDIPSISSGYPAANPIALAMKEGRILAILEDETVTVFEFTGNAWKKKGAPIETGAKQAGSSLSLSADGSRLAVAVPDDGSDNGRVHVYSYDAKTSNRGMWKMLGMELEGYSAQSGFNIELSDDGRRLAIGTWKLLEDSKYDGLYDARRVRVHYLSLTNSWETFGPQIELANTFNRSTVSISLGANGNVLAACTADSCSAYMYNVVTQNWERIGNDVTGGEDVSLSVSGNSMAVGMPSKDQSGVVQIFSNKEGSWFPLGNNIVGTSFGDRTGQSVSLSGGMVAIGSPGSDSAAGANTGMVQTYIIK